MFYCFCKYRLIVKITIRKFTVSINFIVLSKINLYNYQNNRKNTIDFELYSSFLQQNTI